MPEYELLEAETSVDVSKLINQRAQQGWKLISLHVTERINGFPRYSVLVALCHGLTLGVRVSPWSST